MFEELCFMAKVLWESMCVRESARRVLWRKFIIFSMRNYFAPAIKSCNRFRREIKKLISNKTSSHKFEMRILLLRSGVEQNAAEFIASRSETLIVSYTRWKLICRTLISGEWFWQIVCSGFFFDVPSSWSGIKFAWPLTRFALRPLFRHKTVARRLCKHWNEI